MSESTYRNYLLGPRILTTGHYGLLEYVLGKRPSGVALEFGVGQGNSTRIIAEHMPVIGFDSFRGLPKFWREGFPKGTFACDPPRDIPNCRLVIGQYDQTLWSYPFGEVGPIGLVHLDADLYESTAIALRHIGPHLHTGCYVVFDEWHGYPDCEQFEQRAWREFIDETGFHWMVVGHTHEQWAIRLREK